MIVSTKGRYALRVMIDLAEHAEDGYIPLKEIAERQGISKKYLEAILKDLVKEHLLTGLRGKGGGYRLSRAPEEISVGSIIRLTEGTMAPVACLEGTETPHCPRSLECRTLPMWLEFDQLINEFLDRYTVADLMAPPGPPELSRRPASGS